MARNSPSQSAFGNRFYHWLNKQCKLPWAYSVRIVRGAKTLSTPLEYVQRKSLAARVAAESPFAQKVKEADGYWLFQPHELPGSAAAAASCAAIFDRLQSKGTLRQLDNNKKRHLRAIVKGEQFANDPDIGRFALSRPVLEVASSYFGTAPVLSCIALLWSVPTDTAETIISSQHYHLDGEDVRQLKLFLNVWKHDDANGPLTYFPASTSARILQSVDRGTKLNAGSTKFDDSQVLSGSSGQHPVRVVGDSGSGVFLDTSRCIHFGSRHNSKERLMLMLQYGPYNMARESAIPLGPTGWFPVEGADKLQRSALRN